MPRYEGNEVTSDIIKTYDTESVSTITDKLYRLLKIVVGCTLASYFACIIINNQYGAGKRSLFNIVATRGYLAAKLLQANETNISLHAKMLLGGDVVVATKAWNGYAYVFAPKYIQQHIKNLT